MDYSVRAERTAARPHCTHLCLLLGNRVSTLAPTHCLAPAIALLARMLAVFQCTHVCSCVGTCLFIASLLPTGPAGGQSVARGPPGMAGGMGQMGNRYGNMRGADSGAGSMASGRGVPTGRGPGDMMGARGRPQGAAGMMPPMAAGRPGGHMVPRTAGRGGGPMGGRRANSGPGGSGGRNDAGAGLAFDMNDFPSLGGRYGDVHVCVRVCGHLGMGVGMHCMFVLDGPLVCVFVFSFLTPVVLWVLRGWFSSKDARDMSNAGYRNAAAGATAARAPAEPQPFAMSSADFPALPQSGGRGSGSGGRKGGRGDAGVAGGARGRPPVSGFASAVASHPPKGDSAARAGAGHQHSAGMQQYGLLGMLHVIRMGNPDLTTLALGLDLTTLGLNLNSPEYVLRLCGLHSLAWLATGWRWTVVVLHVAKADWSIGATRFA